MGIEELQAKYNPQISLVKPQEIKSQEIKPEETKVEVPQQACPSDKPCNLDLSPDAVAGRSQVKQLSFAERAMLEIGEYISDGDMDIIKDKKYQAEAINSANEVEGSKKSVEEFIKDKSLTGIRVSYTNKEGKQVKETMIYDKNAGENHAYYVETETSPNGGYGKSKSDIGGGKVQSEAEYKEYIMNTLKSIQEEKGNLSKIEIWE